MVELFVIAVIGDDNRRKMFFLRCKQAIGINYRWERFIFEETVHNFLYWYVLIGKLQKKLKVMIFAVFHL
jgi:hypothetical protein